MQKTVRLEYPAVLSPDEDDGGFVVSFLNLKECIVRGSL